ncbi:MAG: molybdopterin converting factor subunit 1 [Acidobacteriaceae bacterium]
MHVRVLLFGALKDLLAREGETIELPDQATVQDFLHSYLQNSPQIENFISSLAVAVNREYATVQHVLHDGDEVALLPPVSGGAGETFTQPIGLQRGPIDAATLTAQVKDGPDGAVVIFDGIVRNNTRGRRTLHLDYEAYEAMAQDRMRGLVRDARQRFAVREIVLVHRLGRLQVGETSVWIAVSSAHRAPAFDACRWLIDTLKKTVPIWKKEFFEDGAAWADGEPFPEDISPLSTAEREP